MAQPGLFHYPNVGKRFPFRITDVQLQFDGHLVKPHWHDHIEFIKIMKGSVSVTLDQDQFEAGENEIVFINSRQIHSIRSLSGQHVRINGIIFDKFFVTNFLEGFDSMHAYQLFFNTGIRSGRQSFSPVHPIWSELNECMELAKNEFSGKQHCFEMAIKSSIYRIVTAVIRYYLQQGIGNAGAGDTWAGHRLDLIRSVMDYIVEHMADTIRICVKSSMSVPIT